MPLPKLKNLIVSETHLRFCAIDLQISFLALAFASKKIKNHQWNSRNVVTIWGSQWNLGFSKFSKGMTKFLKFYLKSWRGYLSKASEVPKYVN